MTLLYNKKKFKNWWKLHKSLLKQEKVLQKAGANKEKSDKILFDSVTVKIRLEYSRYFASEVLRLRKDEMAGDELRRNFEAWLFFVRSALDCLAQLINDICDLGLKDAIVDIQRVRDKLNGRKDLHSLYTIVRNNIRNDRGAWFWHLNRSRNISMHRSVIRMIRYEYIGGSRPFRRDKRFVLADPQDLQLKVNKPELGLGSYAEDKSNRVYELIEKVCKSLYAGLSTRRIRITW